MSDTTTYVTAERWGETSYYCRGLDEVRDLIDEVCCDNPGDFTRPEELVEGVDYYARQYFVHPNTGDAEELEYIVLDFTLTPEQLDHLQPVVPYCPAPIDAVEWVPFDN